MSVEERIFELADAVVAECGVQLLDVEYVGATLRLVVIGADDDGVTTDQLAKVNRAVGAVLDEADPIPGRYTLEVSSPGLERRLVKPAHYQRSVGETVVVKLLPHLDTRRIKGTLVSVDDDLIVVKATEIDGIDLPDVSEQRIELADIDKTRTVFEWGPAPKPGQPKKKRGNA
ncbi:MAG: ribosome maturation factor RimP [Acidimicrobiales bacterium]